jgi:hypothetical protein
VTTIGVLAKALEDTTMRSLMTTLQQPLSVALLVRCLGWATGRPQSAAAGLRQRRRRPAARLQPTAADVAAQVALAAGAADETADRPRCGWFDSSHELHQGLVVLEHAGAEGLGAELPLHDWLGFVLDGVPQPSGRVLVCGQSGHDLTLTPMT